MNTTNSDTAQTAYSYLLTCYIACLVIAQVLATRLSQLDLPFIGTLTFTGGEIAYALTFLFTDVIAEIWGKKRATVTVLCGLAANILVFVLIRITLIMPPSSFGDGGEAFKAVVGSTSRIIIASMVAFIISQTHDVWMFHLLKKATNNRFMWIRNNGSTFVSQTIDTTIFTVLAFWGTAPVLPLIFGQLIAKYILAALDTPFAYLLVWLCRKQIHGDKNLTSPVAI